MQATQNHGQRLNCKWERELIKTNIPRKKNKENRSVLENSSEMQMINLLKKVGWTVFRGYSTWNNHGSVKYDPEKTKKN